MRYLAIVALLAAASARADVDPDAPLHPIAVRGKLDGTMAKLTARFVLHVNGPGRDEGVLLSIPFGSIVTGATAIADGSSHRLSLETTERAEAAFDALATAPATADRRWGLKVDAAPGTSTVTIDTAAPHAGRVDVDLEIDVPTCFDRDLRYAVVPAEWLPALDRALHHGDGDIACLGEETKLWIAFASNELAALPFGDRRIGGIAGRLPLDESHLARVELDLSREISDVPADLYTAIVIDASRSVSDDEVEAQRVIVESYLRHAPHSRVQVIAYARKARALLPGWTDASQALPRVDRELRALTQNNGSNIDVALAEAAKWLAATHGTRRIVVFSDERLAQRLLDATPLALRSEVPEATLVHVVALGPGEGALARADDTLLAPLARATEGIAVRGVLDANGAADATLLVRPISLDEIRVHAAGWQDFAGSNEAGATLMEGASLAEGSSSLWWGQGDASSGPVMIDGLVWGRRFTRILRPDPAKARVLARELSALGTLESELQKQVDRVAHAVNSVWSLDGEWGGTGGYDDVGGMGRAGFGMSSCGCDSATSNDHFGGGGSGQLRRGTLHDQLAAGVASCHPGDATVMVTLETTLEEIVNVDVWVEELPSAEPARAIHDCVVESVWDTFISIPAAPEHSTIPLTFTHA